MHTNCSMFDGQNTNERHTSSLIVRYSRMRSQHSTELGARIILLVVFQLHEVQKICYRDALRGDVLQVHSLDPQNKENGIVGLISIDIAVVGHHIEEEKSMMLLLQA